MTPAELRALFPVTACRAYMFSGGLSPAAKPVREAIENWIDGWSTDPARLYATYPQEWERARLSFAAVIKADPEEIAFMDSTSRGSNVVVQMIDAPPGSNVVVDEYTYWASLAAWQLPAKAHVDIRRVPARHHRVQRDDLAEAVDEDTVALSVTHVSWQTGYKHDLAALSDLAHSRGALLIVDAAQSAGVLDIDVHRLKIDFLSGVAMKWMLGAPGVGFLYVAREHIERFAPPQVSYAGLENLFPPNPLASPSFKTTAARHELAIPALPALVASRAGADLLISVGLAEVERHVLDLTGYCIEQLLHRDLRVLTPIEPERRAGVISVPVVQGKQLISFLRERGVDVWYSPNIGVLRVDPHVFNNRDDVDRLLEGLDHFTRTNAEVAQPLSP
jgi:selenocysteine lyase/cysteine desulfurase